MHDPFFIVPKTPFSEITKRIDGTDAAFCVSVFVALRCLANDEHLADGPVQLSKAQIASKAGLSYNTVERILPLLQSLGVIGIELRFVPGTKSPAPSVYTFPTLRGTPSPTLEGTFPTEPPPVRADIIKNGKDLKDLLGSAKAAPKKPRERNQLLDALAALDGSDPSQVTGSAWSGTAKALSEIKAVCPGVTLEEIANRARRYRSKYPNATCSAHALAKHWGSLVAPVDSEPAPRRVSAA